MENQTKVNVILWRFPALYMPGHDKLKTLERFRTLDVRMGCILIDELGLLKQKDVAEYLTEKGYGSYCDPSLCLVYTCDMQVRRLDHIFDTYVVKCRMLDKKTILFVGLNPHEVECADKVGLSTALFDPEGRYSSSPLPIGTGRVQSAAAVEELVCYQPTSRVLRRVSSQPPKSSTISS